MAIGDASGVGVRGGLDRDPVAWLGLQKGIEDCDARPGPETWVGGTAVV